MVYTNQKIIWKINEKSVDTDLKVW